MRELHLFAGAAVRSMGLEHTLGQATQNSVACCYGQPESAGVEVNPKKE